MAQASGLLGATAAPEPASAAEGANLTFARRAAISGSVSRTRRCSRLGGLERYDRASEREITTQEGRGVRAADGAGRYSAVTISGTTESLSSQIDVLPERRGLKEMLTCGRRPGYGQVVGQLPPARVRLNGSSSSLASMNSNIRAVTRCCAGVIIQAAERLDRVIFRSPDPSLSPGNCRRGPPVPSGHVVFRTAIDVRGERAFDISLMYFRTPDHGTGSGRSDPCPENGCAICASTGQW